ncbi:hypothetical protein [Bradyrhizobium sp. CCBAU 65884]|uniref:hypothetical protein n=1 Tax=Bradyrhizobium sp. CCBAU 65884 TaxID=722477 RepID=UPI0023053C94|nr:hypothetical protein [Bradyrhizobium sp. CCBAU 65884]
MRNATAMRLAEGARIPISSALVEKLVGGRADDECVTWTEYVTSVIDRAPHGVIIPLGQVCADRPAATHAARAVADHLVSSWRKRWFLDNLTTEIGEDQITEVALGRRTRSLLPHHDGGNSSYLTPSRFDVASWTAELRRTFSPQASTTRTHKLYQGFLVLQVGEGESVTPYYDLVTILMLAYRHQIGVTSTSVLELQDKCAKDLRHCIALLQSQGGGYLQLSAPLGARNPKHILVNLHNIDTPFSDAEVAAFPEIQNSALCPAQALFEEMILETTGFPWKVVRGLTEQCLQAKELDFVIGHNIMLMHGALNGGPSRLLRPVCAVLEDASGPAYEHWLSVNWHTAFRRATSVLDQIQWPLSRI